MSHPIVSIALQSFKVPLMVVVMTLSVLQTMTFLLPTGYGVAYQGCGVMMDNPTFGYGQGNGMAHPAFWESVP